MQVQNTRLSIGSGQSYKTVRLDFQLEDLIEELTDEKADVDEAIMNVLQQEAIDRPRACDLAKSIELKIYDCHADRPRCYDIKHEIDFELKDHVRLKPNVDGDVT